MRRNFVPQIIPKSWVKNVYGLRLISVIRCGFVSTHRYVEEAYSQKAGEKHSYYTPNTLTQPAFFSTVFIDILHLLIHDLYLFSTRPTITNTIKKLINNS